MYDTAETKNDLVTCVGNKDISRKAVETKRAYPLTGDSHMTLATRETLALRTSAVKPL